MRPAPLPMGDVKTERLAHLAPYRDAVRRYFLRRVGNPDDAEDLTHDLFLRITGRESQDGGEVPQALIFAAAANLLKDRARRARVVAWQQQALAVPIEATGGTNALHRDEVRQGRSHRR